MKLRFKSALYLVLAALSVGVYFHFRADDGKGSEVLPAPPASPAASPVVEDSAKREIADEAPVLRRSDDESPRLVVRKTFRLSAHPAIKNPLQLSRRLDDEQPTPKATVPAPVPPEKTVEVRVARSPEILPKAEKISSEDTSATAATSKAPTSSFNYGLGAGVEHFPRWLGASTSKNFPIPYINLNWQNLVQFSTVDGLIIDLIGGERWHGGLVGTMMWGRSAHDLGVLSNRVPTLINTFQAGAYLEYAVTKALSVGVRLRHDIEGTGAAYGDLYLDTDLPAPGPIEHSVKFAVEGMNHSAMNRYFGVNDQTAVLLGSAPYRPGGGRSALSLTYQAFIPTSEHTGFAVSAAVARLSRAAADSPLVQDFGSPIQRNFAAAFVVHY